MRSKRTVCLMFSVMMVLSVLAGCQAEPADSTNPLTTTQTPGDTFEFDTTLESIRVVVDGIVHNFDVRVAKGSWYISA